MQVESKEEYHLEDLQPQVSLGQALSSETLNTNKCQMPSIYIADLKNLEYINTLQIIHKFYFIFSINYNIFNSF